MDEDRYYDVDDSDYIHIDDYNREMDYLESRLSELEDIENFYLSEERCILSELFDILKLVTDNEPRQFIIDKINYVINLHSKDMVNEIRLKRLDNA
jgi:hypothetical protein